MSRRSFLKGTFALGAVAMIAPQGFARPAANIESLKVGSYIWRPDLSPHGPVVIVISLPEQLVHLHRNGVEIGVSTCSTGKDGHKTPTGVFTQPGSDSAVQTAPQLDHVQQKCARFCARNMIQNNNLEHVLRIYLM